MMVGMGILMSVAVLLAGLVVALLLDASPEMRVFGWVLALVGALGVAGTVLVRRR